MHLGATVGLVRRVLLLLALLAGLATAPAALADVVTTQDNMGRTITLDVRVENVDVEWYAGALDRRHRARKPTAPDRLIEAKPRQHQR